MRRATPAGESRQPAGLDAVVTGRRALTIAWGLPLVVICLWFGGWPLAVGTAVLAVACLREFWHLGLPLGAPDRVPPELLAGAAVLPLVAHRGGQWFDLVTAGTAVGVVAGGVVRVAHGQSPRVVRQRLLGTVWAILGLLYIPWTLGYVVRLRAAGPGALAWTLVLIGEVWLADVVGFVIGGLVGRHRLAPAVSPGKTVEGAVAALMAAGGAGLLLAPLLGLSRPLGALVGLGLAAAGLLGDLWESLLKRGAGVKDSGTAVPGHGGLLDRFDSVFLAAPTAYWLLLVAPHLQGGR